MLRLRHIYKIYHSDRPILRDLNFEISNPGLYFMTGESGSGKTTLFKLLTAISKPTSGEIFFKDQNISKLSAQAVSDYRKKIGIIFQDYKLIPDLNIYDNISLPLKIQSLSRSEIAHRMDAMSELFDLRHFMNEYPEHISGGQQQKSAVARALIHQPDLIIADEPTGNLDSKNSAQVIDTLSEFSKKGALVLIATHDQSILQKTTEMIFTLNMGQISI
jgi:cell division transport system ATP-binding protein